MSEAAATIDAFIERLIRAARIGGISEFDVATLRQLVVGRHEFETILLATRIANLEMTMASMDVGARRDAICQRLGLSRRRFYELREIAASAAPDRTGRR